MEGIESTEDIVKVEPKDVFSTFLFLPARLLGTENDENVLLEMIPAKGKSPALYVVSWPCVSREEAPTFRVVRQKLGDAIEILLGRVWVWNQHPNLNTTTEVNRAGPEETPEAPGRPPGTPPSPPDVPQ